MKVKEKEVKKKERKNEGRKRYLPKLTSFQLITTALLTAKSYLHQGAKALYSSIK